MHLVGTHQSAVFKVQIFQSGGSLRFFFTIALNTSSRRPATHFVGISTVTVVGCWREKGESGLVFHKNALEIALPDIVCLVNYCHGSRVVPAVRAV